MVVRQVSQESVKIELVFNSYDIVDVTNRSRSKDISTLVRNPGWTRGECILAMDLFVRSGYEQLGKNKLGIIELSAHLQEMQLHEPSDRSEKFRNPNGVVMKLANFCALDERCHGIGRPNGGAMDEIVWDEFKDNEQGLREAAEAVRRQHHLPFLPPA